MNARYETNRIFGNRKLSCFTKYRHGYQIIKDRMGHVARMENVRNAYKMKACREETTW